MRKAFLIRVILERNDLEVKSTSVQKKLVNLGRHSAILDVFAEDSKGKIYDIEIQNNPYKAGARMARYYSAMIS